MIRRNPPQKRGDWRRDEGAVGSNSTYGAWSKGDGVALQHLNDLRMARHYTQFGLAMAPRQGAQQDGGPPRTASERPCGPGEIGRLAEGRNHSDQARPPKANLCNLMGPGDTTPAQGFPGAPGASRGLPGGSHVLWSFERTPSLLHGPMDRDRGRHGRSCAGDPPALRAMNEAAPRDQSSPSHQAVSEPPRGQSGQSRGTSREMSRSRSESSLMARWPTPKPVGGLQGLAGVTWDDAKVAAGGALRGSDGRYLGY
mmetsp:Transcript_110021/g.343033  ORF Transcript_110021/g.343033 Transcript_110021/m.343033 type:complete len:255 (+) Transcript_110021:47-811(+)